MKKRSIIISALIMLISFSAFGAFAKNFNQLYLRGTFNSWAGTEMNLVNDHIWETTATFGSTSNERFKFDVEGDWSENYGDDNGNGFVERSGEDIPVDPGYRYTVKLNDQTMSYGVFIDMRIYYACEGYQCQANLSGSNVKVYLKKSSDNYTLMEEASITYSGGTADPGAWSRHTLQINKTYKVVLDVPGKTGETEFDVTPGMPTQNINVKEQQLPYADIYIHPKPDPTQAPDYNGLTVVLMKDGAEIQSKDIGFSNTGIASIRFEDLEEGEYEVVVDDTANNKVYKGKADLIVTVNSSNWTNINVFDCGAQNVRIRPAQSHSTSFNLTCGYDGIWTTGTINVPSNAFTENINVHIDNKEYGDNTPADNTLDDFTYNPNNYVVIPQDVDFEMTINAHSKEYEIKKSSWKRTIIFMYGETETGQDMFIRGGVDWDYSKNVRGVNCDPEQGGNKWDCAIPIKHLNLKNNTTAPWKTGDDFLDWYGNEDDQSSESKGSALDWTTNSWPSDWGSPTPYYAVNGYGETSLNNWGHHYWIMEVNMDCSKTVNGWFELKSFISNGAGWEGEINQQNTPYTSKNHFARCGYKNVFRRNENSVVVMENLNNNDKCTQDINFLGDEDEDGIPDCAEQSGYEFNGIPVYEYGARQGVKDIFIEIDYMQSVDQGIIPQRESLQKVVDSFAAQNIAIHFDVGNLYHPSAEISPEDFDLGGGNELPYTKGLSLGTNSDSRASATDFRASDMDDSRKSIFYYMVFGNSQRENGASGSSGRAYINGNISIITIGSWGLNRSSDSLTNKLINYQAGTIMHEFGHNLGLLHGGDEGRNYKPNYLSVMNYRYQLKGLPTIGDDEGDRYLAYHYNNNSSCGSNTWRNITNNAYDDHNNFIIDYSHGVSIAIDEAAINEAAGFGHSGSNAIDFNCNGNNSETLNDFDINNDNRISLITDSNDWNDLNIVFYTTLNNGANPSKSSMINTVISNCEVPHQ